MKKNISNFLFNTFNLFFCFGILTYAQLSEITTTEIYPGIIHEQIINKHDRLVINILKIDLKNDSYEIEALKANDLLKSKETTSQLSKRISDEGHFVIAAINGDFWLEDGEIINNMISNGKFVKATAGHSDDKQQRIFPQFAFTIHGKPLIEKFDFAGKLFLNKGTIEKINRINSRTDSSSITLYNYFQGDETPKANKNWNLFEAVLKPIYTLGDTLVFLASPASNKEGETGISKTGFVISAANQKADELERELRKSDTVKVLLRLLPDEGKISTLTGGIPQIVKDGKNLAAESDTLEGMKPSFTVTKHPRTGVGFSKDSTTFYMFTVDGRQESSSGMSLKEFAGLMISNGVYQGLNLDGGGSTTMVIDGKLVNHPSDITGERPVGNCLVIIKKN